MSMRVHVGIDRSGPSRAAVHWAARYASDGGVPLVLNHVVDDVDAPPDSAAMAELIERGEELLRHSRTLIADIIDVKSVSAHVLVGDVAQALADECTEQDLLVVGTHKTGFLRGRAFGARGISIVATARGAVAVIPEDHRSSRSGVVIAVSSPGWAAAVEAGVRCADRDGQSIVLVAAEGEGDAPSPPDLHDALEYVRHRAPAGAIRSQTTRRYLADAVLDASQGATLLVLQEPLAANRMRSTGALVHDVLLNINCPVMIVR